MKVETSENKIEHSGINNSKKFQINLTSHTFDILSKNIYSDVPMAIIRELIHNGIDACKRIKVEDPVEVYLPTLENPSLDIIDHG